MTARRDVSRQGIDNNEKIAFSDQSAFSSSPFHSTDVNSTSLKVKTIEFWKISLINRNKSRNVISRYTSVRMRYRFSKLTNENIDGNTNVVIFYSCFVNAHRPTKVRYFIFIYISPLPGNKSRHFRLTQFPALNEKGTPVVMSEFSSLRAERSQRNRYADATFYFSKRIASGFSAFTEQLKMSLFCCELLRL